MSFSEAICQCGRDRPIFPADPCPDFKQDICYRLWLASLHQDSPAAWREDQRVLTLVYRDQVVWDSREVDYSTVWPVPDDMARMRRNLDESRASYGPRFHRLVERSRAPVKPWDVQILNHLWDFDLAEARRYQQVVFARAAQRQAAGVGPA